LSSPPILISCAYDHCIAIIIDAMNAGGNECFANFFTGYMPTTANNAPGVYECLPCRDIPGQKSVFGAANRMCSGEIVCGVCAAKSMTLNTLGTGHFMFN
jgi:hypothetical protein